MKEQCENRRTTRWLTYNGETKTAAEWARTRGWAPTLINDRIFKRNWTVERALSLEPNSLRINKTNKIKNLRWDIK